MENNIVTLDGMEKMERDDKAVYLPSKSRFTTERELKHAKLTARAPDYSVSISDGTSNGIEPFSGNMFFDAKDMAALSETINKMVEEMKKYPRPTFYSSKFMKDELGVKLYEPLPEDSKICFLPDDAPAFITIDSLSMVADMEKSYKEDLTVTQLKGRQAEVDTGFFYAPYMPNLLNKFDENTWSTDAWDTEVKNPCNEIALPAFPLKGKPINLCEEIVSPYHDVDLTLKEDFTFSGFYEMPKTMKTGNDLLDEMLGGGLRAGTLTIIAAKAGVGKSALAKNVAAGLSINGVEFLWVGAEQEPEAVIDRIQAINQHNCDTPYKVVHNNDWCTNGLINCIREQVEDSANTRVVFVDDLSLYKDAGSHVLGNQLHRLAVELDVAIVATNGLHARSLDDDGIAMMPVGDLGLTAAASVIVTMRKLPHGVELGKIKDRNTYRPDRKVMFDLAMNLFWEPLKTEVFECTFPTEEFKQSMGRGSRVTELPSGDTYKQAREVTETGKGFMAQFNERLKDLVEKENKLIDSIQMEKIDIKPFNPVILPIKSQLMPFANLKAIFAPKAEDNYPTADWL